MEAIAQKPAVPNRTANFILITLAIVLLWTFSPMSPTTLALLAIAALFFFGLKRPVWAMAALLVSQFTITSYMVNTPFGTDISLRIVLIIITVLVLFQAFIKKQIELGPKVWQIIIPGLILLFLGVASNLINGTDAADFPFQDFRNTASFLLITILLPAVVRDTKELKIICGVVFITVTASTIIGLMQYFNFLGASSATITPDLFSTISRVPGMSETELELSYILVTVILAGAGIYLVKGLNTGLKRLLLLSLVLMVPTLYFTFTRSALLALLFGFVALFLFFKTRLRGGLVMVGILLILTLIFTSGLDTRISLSGRSEAAQQESTVARKILTQASMAIIMDNPILGVGGDRFKGLAPQYEASIDSSLLNFEEDQYWGYSTLGNEGVHNDFLNTWVCYGTLALAAYLWLFFAILHRFLKSYQMSGQRFIKGLSIGLAAAVIAYSVNAFYHNLEDTLPLFWILAGFSLVTFKLALGKPNNHRAKEVATTG
jgi:O-antigen ligase